MNFYQNTIVKYFLYLPTAHPAIVKLLIEKGADVNAVDYVKNGKSTPLHKAVNGADTDERYEVVNLLINAGADINARNVAGKTALEYAKSSRSNFIQQIWKIQHLFSIL